MKTLPFLCAVLLLACGGKVRWVEGQDEIGGSTTQEPDGSGGTRLVVTGGASAAGGAPGVGGGTSTGGSTLATGGSLSPDECEEQATRTVLCGTNDNGTRVDSCTGGQWVEGDCDNPFLSVWRMPQGYTSLSLPLVENGTYDFQVEWGDGSSSHIAAWDSPDKTHVFAQAGDYALSITGTFEGWSLGMTSDAFNASKLLEISRFGPLVLGQTDGQFRDASALRITATDAPGLQKTTSLAYAFFNCTFEKAASLALWDVSTIADMGHLFERCYVFNDDITGWDVSNVTNLSSMFFEAYFFNQDLGAWDVSSVTSMNSTFTYATDFNQDIGGWTTSKVTDMTCLFYGAATFNQDIGAWDVSKVTSMNSIFWYADNFDQDLGAWDVSAALDVAYFFGPSSSFSTASYDKLLIGWSARNLQRDLYFSLGPVRYSSAAAPARLKIVDAFGWSIDDGGPL